MPSKMSVFFTTGIAGWSETYYHPKEVTDPTLGAAAQSFIAARRPLLNAQVRIQAVRFADLVNARRVVLFPQTVSGLYSGAGQGLGIGLGVEVDMPFTAILIRMNLANGGRREIFLRGLADDITHWSQGRIIDGNWVGAFATFGTFLVNNGYLGNTLNAAANAPRLISDVRVVLNKVQIRVLTHDYTDNMRIRISRFVSSPPLNGLWTIRRIDGDWVELNGSDTALTAIPFNVGGKAYSQRMTNPAITSVVQVRFARKGVGRPFGLLRGKKRKARPQVPTVLTGL